MEIPASFFKVSFNKAMAFGYKTEDVDGFVTQAIQNIKDLQEENETLREKMGILAGSLEKYRDEEDSLRSALVGAQKLGDSILRDSRSRAEAILRDATNRADKLTQDAALELERSQYALEQIHSETGEFKEKLFSLYRTHLALINNIPSGKAVTEQYDKHSSKSEESNLQENHSVQESSSGDYGEEYDDQQYDDDHHLPEEHVSEDTDNNDSPNDIGSDEYIDSAQKNCTDNYSEPYTEEYDDAPSAETEEQFELPPEPEFINAFDNANAEYAETQSTPGEQANLTVEATGRSHQEDDGTTYYTPRIRPHSDADVFEPLPMVQMEFSDSTQDDDPDDDQFSADTKNLRSVDLNRIPYFDDEDDEDDIFESQMTSGKKRPLISQKFGVLKFGDSFKLTDD